jgi:GNAT superfamily N-acetyltransferase
VSDSQILAAVIDPTATFRTADPSRPPASELLAEMVDELEALYGIVDRRIGVPLHVEELAPPTGLYLVGCIGDLVVAGGGLRTIGDGLAEIKRMYVRDVWRGRGLGGQLLFQLEDAARNLGFTRVRLDTGPRQPAALRLYERTGYRPIGNYNNNPDATFWGEKTLPQVDGGR